MVREDCLEEEAGMTLGFKGRCFWATRRDIPVETLRSGDPEAGSSTRLSSCGRNEAPLVERKSKGTF